MALVPSPLGLGEATQKDKKILPYKIIKAGGEKRSERQSVSGHSRIPKVHCMHTHVYVCMFVGMNEGMYVCMYISCYMCAYLYRYT